jgi:hypothetical protein
MIWSVLLSFRLRRAIRGLNGYREVVPFEQLFAGQLEQCDIGAVHSSEGNRASFRRTETQSQIKVWFAMIAMRPCFL